MRDPDDGRFLSIERAKALTEKLRKKIFGGGFLYVNIDSQWNSQVTWSDNSITFMGEHRDTQVSIIRHVRGNSAMTASNEIDDDSLLAALRRTEALARLSPERGNRMTALLNVEEHSSPQIWSDETYGIDSEGTATVAATAVNEAKKLGFVTAGFLQASAYGQVHNRDDNATLYYPSTKVDFSLTVRSPDGSASGWAGTDNSHWNRIDFSKLIKRAVEKCHASRNPVLIEPGRYNVVLEPQAVADFFSPVFGTGAINRRMAEERDSQSPFSLGNGDSKIGLRIFDSRITITSNPMDPELGFPPFDYTGAAYNPAVWVENGVLKNLAYDRYYAVQQLGSNAGLQASGSYRIAGTNLPIERLIGGLERGLLITRFSGIGVSDFQSLTVTGYTRDGVWLVVKGKIEQAVRNFRFSDSILSAFNRVEQIGMAERVYSPYAPVMVPSMRIKDFNMVSLSSSI